MSSKKLLIVGAGGFIGGFIATRALDKGYDTWVAVRESTSRRYLQDQRLHFLVLDYDDPGQVDRTIAEALPEGERWDYVIYNLGATKCANFLDFNHINFNYLRTFVEALKKTDKVPEKLLFMSSLSALGPADERTYLPLDASTVPNPNTRYGLSKIKAEQYLEYTAGIPYIIFRPTGVYGPHERDYLMMIKSIDSHFDFGVGYRKQMLTFIYVDDLVEAMFLALNSPNTTGKKYIISEDRAYTQKEFREIVSRRLGRKFVLPLKLPMAAVWVASFVAEKIGMFRNKPSTLNRDKFKIMRQRNWNCDVTPAKTDFGFNPQFSLERGIDATVEAYLAEKQNKKR